MHWISDELVVGTGSMRGTFEQLTVAEQAVCRPSLSRNSRNSLAPGTGQLSALRQLIGIERVVLHLGQVFGGVVLTLQQ